MSRLGEQALRSAAKRSFARPSPAFPLASTAPFSSGASARAEGREDASASSAPSLLRRLGLCGAGAVFLFEASRQEKEKSVPLAPKVSFSRLFSRDTRAQQLAAHAGVAACAGKVRQVDLGAADDFECGGVYEVAVNGGVEKILLTRTAAGTFFCTGASCSHYGVSLAKGVLTVRGTVTCPLHDAEFDIKTGKCVNGPGLSAIPTYPVQVKGGRVVADLPTDIAETAEPNYAKTKTGKNETIVILGGGAAAGAAAETLRTEGFDGRIVMITAEKFPPYDRPMLTKNLNAQPEQVELRSLKTLQEDLDIQVLVATRATGVDVNKKIVNLEGAPDIKFDKLLLCTGSDARKLSNLPNVDARGIFTLRTLEDHQELNKFYQESKKQNSEPRIAVVGSSFTGLEVASSFKGRCSNVTVIGMESVPFERALGARVGESMKNLITSKGVRYYPRSSVTGFTKSRGRVTGVELASGEVVQADIVIIGAGSVPATQFLKNGDALPLCKDGSIITDPLLRVPSSPDVFVAGDIATYPYVKTGDLIRVEHWAVAMQQGRVAALNMLGRHVPFTQIPFFWSRVFGNNMRFAGWIGGGFDEVIIEGDLEKHQFVAYYVKNDRVQAVCAMNRDPVAVAAIELLQLNLMPTPGELRQGLKNSQDIVAVAKDLAAGKIVKRVA
ncbi:pyridine nucleotide-disulfide oxidoreductase domain-containing protein [Besnoitia besnoiti]|uniref:Pyridine nucleotide-disulfide oxidoreductase domain-containing protein n=1 Tax=Besnoitia besnoiti TaxID=94643 RepID=A0A2A9M8M2_BESBE|nr:pyridine nucleotide-disulfide oxidoreductase domain-containing protein [Besnoitia besnoiti]PFH31742.1 pyridine nucleotide-disulfide oxidoreductase domain-containing protein [Besnoitia besnoiti]